MKKFLFLFGVLIFIGSFQSYAERDAYLKLTPINGTKSANRMIRITNEMISNSDGYVKVD